MNKLTENPVVVLIGLVASIIAIFVFITGYDHLNDVSGSNQPVSPPIIVITQVVQSAPQALGDPTISNPPTSSVGSPTSASNNSYATISCENDITQASLRKSPGYVGKDDSTDVLYKIDCGQTVQLLGEKQDADGLTWWKISWSGYVGWMADHSGNGRIILVFN